MTKMLTKEEVAEIRDLPTAAQVIESVENDKMVTPDGNVILDGWAYRVLTEVAARQDPLLSHIDALTERLEAMADGWADSEKVFDRQKNFDASGVCQTVKNELRALIEEMKG